MKLVASLCLFLISGTALCNTYLDNLVLLKSQDLQQSKQLLKTYDTYRDTLAQLISKADALLSMKPVSVTQNQPLPVSGNPHDYYSVGPYWWPDPKKEDGLPWINRDGEVNPQLRGPDSDRKLFQQLVNAVRMLAIAYHYTESAKYADKAEQLLATWFINTDTKMHPHLNFAQAIPGRTHGRGIGIIDFRAVPYLLDSLVLISPHTNKDFEEAMELWLSVFLGWLIESQNGQDEAAMKNNHGTFYDVITLSLASYLGFEEVAVMIINNAKKRIRSQIADDGSQAHELKRTRPYHYSAFNLLAFTQLASMAQKWQMDLWQFPSPKDARIHLAYQFMLANQQNTQYWPGKQETNLPPEKLLIAGLRFYRQARDAQMPFMTSTWDPKNQELAAECALLLSLYLPLNNKKSAALSKQSRESRPLCQY